MDQEECYRWGALFTSDTRGDIIFDIFRLSPQSYLWHFNRVYTRPEQKGVDE
jgi:hypothetical protein